MRRVLLVNLGRRGEALDSAWAEYREHPGRFTYEVLVRYVPKAEHTAWHEKAMEVSEHGDLDSVIGRWLAAKETGRLAARLDCTSDSELEDLSHYVTEPAAEFLVKTHPGVAAKVFRALCMRIVNEGKSQYYFAALSSIEKAIDRSGRRGRIVTKRSSVDVLLAKLRNGWGRGSGRSSSRISRSGESMPSPTTLGPIARSQRTRESFTPWRISDIPNIRLNAAISPRRERGLRAHPDVSSTLTRALAKVLPAAIPTIFIHRHADVSAAD